jgi:hypothetical protein
LRLLIRERVGRARAHAGLSACFGLCRWLKEEFKVAPDRFAVILEDYVKQCRNRLMEPETHATYIRAQLLCADVASTLKQRLAFAESSKDCTPQAMQAFVDANILGGAAEDGSLCLGLVHGNLSAAVRY